VTREYRWSSAIALLQTSAAALLYRPGVVGMSNHGDPDIVTGTGLASRSGAVPAPRGPHEPRDPWLRIGPEGAVPLPPPRQPGHGRTASLRRQPVRIVDGRMEGGYTDTFELICPGCEWRGPQVLPDEHSGSASRLHGSREVLDVVLSVRGHLPYARSAAGARVRRFRVEVPSNPLVGPG
jgi:hypothetical protein